MSDTRRVGWPLVDLCRAPNGPRDRQLLMGEAVDLTDTPASSPGPTRGPPVKPDIGPRRQPMLARQRLRAPFVHLACVVFDQGAGSADRLGPDRSRDPAAPLAVAQTAEKAVRFFVENGLDGAADIRAQTVLGRVEAVVASE